MRDAQQPNASQFERVRAILVAIVRPFTRPEATQSCAFVGMETVLCRWQQLV